jgi:hypothetical protein
MWIIAMGAVDAAPDNYGVTHAFAVHLTGTFVSENITDNELAVRLSQASVAWHYFNREPIRKRGHPQYRDSVLDKWAPIAALLVETVYPQYTDKLYNRMYQEKGIVYFTLINGDW